MPPGGGIRAADHRINWILRIQATPGLMNAEHRRTQASAWPEECGVHEARTQLNRFLESAGPSLGHERRTAGMWGRSLFLKEVIKKA